MGDKSPRDKNRAKKQSDVQKGKDQAAHDAKQAKPVAPGKK